MTTVSQRDGMVTVLLKLGGQAKLVAERRDLSRVATDRRGKAGDEIRTHDIHVGNVTLYH